MVKQHKPNAQEKKRAFLLFQKDYNRRFYKKLSNHLHEDGHHAQATKFRNKSYKIQKLKLADVLDISDAFSKKDQNAILKAFRLEKIRQYPSLPRNYFF